MATAIAAKMSMRTRIKAHRGRPQQRRAGFLSSALDSALSKSAGCVGCDASWGTSCRPGARGHDVVLNQELRRARGSRVACAGGGNAANMSENPDRRWSDKSFSSNLLLGKSLRSSNRLAGLFPLSIMAASVVARLMRSGRLVKLPLASAALTASMSSLSGRLREFLSRPPDGVGVPVGLGAVAAAYAPRIVAGVTSESAGAVDDALASLGADLVIGKVFEELVEMSR
jgi:hypothetical protein